MPIDRAQIVKEQELALEDLLNRRKAGIGSGIDQTRAEIGQMRGETLGPGLEGSLSGIASQYNLNPSVVGAGMAQSAPIQGRLGDQLEESLSQRRFGADRERVNLAYNKALTAATNAGLDRRSAEQYATQFSQDEIRRMNETSNRGDARKQMVIKNNMANWATSQGAAIDANNVPDPNVEYQNAMARILSGLSSNLMANAVAGGFKKTPTTTPTVTPQTPNFAGAGENWTNLYDSYYGGGMTKSGNNGRIAGT